jgi:hypothetical protein
MPFSHNDRFKTTGMRIECFRIRAGPRAQQPRLSDGEDRAADDAAGVPSEARRIIKDSFLNPKNLQCAHSRIQETERIAPLSIDVRSLSVFL